MLLKPNSIIDASFAICAVLAVTLSGLAFEQNAGERKQRELNGKRAEELFQEAITLCDTKESETARLRFLEAMRLWQQIDEPEKAAPASLQMGDCYKQAGRYKESLYYYEQALKVKQVQGSAKAIAYNSMARVYAELYQPDLALRYYDLAVKQARAARDIAVRALVLTGLAQLYYQQGKRTQAAVQVAKARQLNRQAGNKTAEADMLQLIGLIEQEEGRVEKAREAFEEALAIYKVTENVEGEVEVLTSISRLHLKSARHKLALEAAEQAQALAEKQAKRAVSNQGKLKARKLRWRALFSLARAQRAVGQKEEAIRSCSLALAHIEAMWLLVDISTETSAIASREKSQALYLELADLLIEKGRFANAYEWVELGRARALVSFIAARRGTGLSVKLDRDVRLRELSRSIARLRTQLLVSQSRPDLQAKLQAELEDAEHKMLEARLNAELEHPRSRLILQELVTIKKLQEKSLKDKDAILEYALGEDRSFVWLITSNDVLFEILPGRKEIEDAVKQYIDLVSSGPNHLFFEKGMSRLEKASAGLFSVLFGGLSRRISPGLKLIVIPDGLLHYLPFEALRHNGRYLLEDHEISYLPSARMLGLWQDSAKKTSMGSEMDLLAFGDPFFGQEPKGNAGRKSSGGPRNIIRQSGDPLAFQLTQLPRTRDEVEHIASLFPPDRRRVYLGKQSTEEALKRESLGRYRHLHFATHSIVDERSPHRSSVVFTLDNDPEEDGFLQVSEISELDMDCDLVVLSACQTGRGQLLSGEGILGLSRAFLYAGSRSVVVSLWNVSDISTSNLMKSFYKHLTAGLSNAAALREAKLQMAQSGTQARHPYYWAPFIVVGKP